MGKGSAVGGIGLGRLGVARPAVHIRDVMTVGTRWTEPGVPTVRLRLAPTVRFPGALAADGRSRDTDSNSPAHWDGCTFYLLNSAAQPWQGRGPDLFHLRAAPEGVTFDQKSRDGRWIESTWKAADSTLYGWYHTEPPVRVSDPERPGRDRQLAAPRIGAARSRDNGATWQDLGIVLEAPSDSLRRDTWNGYFAGGNGDFTVIPDHRREYLYFLFSTYHADVAEQGVCVARLRYADRDRPAGRVRKWHAGQWSEPGLGGRVTPIFPVLRDWHSRQPDAVWGPSVHWNRYLMQYVVLLNRAQDPGWAQEGIYVTFNPDPSDPSGWSRPRKILGQGQPELGTVRRLGWYPQVIGLDRARQETDKLAGQTARLFLHGRSRWEIRFSLPGEA